MNAFTSSADKTREILCARLLNPGPDSRHAQRSLARQAPGVRRDPVRLILFLASVVLAGLFWGGTAGSECTHYEDYLHWVGIAETSGTSSEVEVAGAYAYVADGLGGLKVIDIADPQNPEIVGGVDTPGAGLGVAVAGTHAYVADCEDGLQVIDITNPTSPQIVGTVDTPACANEVAVAGAYAYVSDRGAGLHVIDIADPENPQIVGSVPLNDTYDVSLAGDYAYVGDGSDAFRVIDISDPQNPQLVGSVETPGYAVDVALRGSYAYIADYYGFQVIDISDPENPQIVGELTIPGEQQAVTLLGDQAYVADYQNALHVIDITNPLAPELMETLEVAGLPMDLTASGTHVYIATSGPGIHVIDVANPEVAPLLGAMGTPGSAVGVAIAGAYAYVADASAGLQVASIADPESPQIVGTANTPGSASDVVLAGNYAHVADGSSGLQVIDITNPASPQIAGAADTPGSATGVAVLGTYTYVADGASGLQVIDAADPFAPFVVGAAATGGNAKGVAVSGAYAYVVADGPGLVVIDISNPNAPEVVGARETTGSAYDVAVSGSYAYVADYGFGLQIIDITDSANPQIVAGVKTPDLSVGVSILGKHVYVADREGGMQVIDITLPEDPRLVGSLDTPHDAYDVAFAGSYAYVADLGSLQVGLIQCASGVCCLSGACELYAESECEALGGEWRAGVTDCDPNPCVPHLYTVNPDGSGDFGTIQEALDASWTADTVALGSGTFVGVGNRDLTYHGRGILVRSVGGDAQECVIDCEQMGRGFMFDAGEGTDAVLTGVMIINGEAPQGGGIYCEDSSPQITDCILLGNRASNGGGAVFCAGSATPDLSGCVLAWNQAPQGGGALECRGNAAPSLVNCVLDHNISGSEGASLASYDMANPVLDHTIVSFGWGGVAVDCEMYAVPELTCCDVYGNELGDYTGCIQNFEGVDFNFSADPFFCGESNPVAYYAMAEDSPCAPENNPTCGLVGVAGIGCAMHEVLPGGGGEYETIQAAVDAAQDGDIVMLVGGAFEGQGNRGISMYGRAIIIRTFTRGRQGTVIDCGGVTRGFIFDSGEGPGSVLEGLTIVNGIAENGGAVFCSTGTSPRLIDCSFTSDRATQRGGGLCCWGGSAPEVIRCTFEGDTAEAGGAVSCLAGATPSFEECRFQANHAQSGGAVHCEAGGGPTISRSTFVENLAAVSGGACYIAAGASPILTRCTLIENGAPSGGGIYSANPLGTIENTIIAYSSSGGACAGVGGVFSCSDLYGNTGGDWTGAIAGQADLRGNLSLDPYFCDLPNGDYHLWNYSPCNQVTCGLIGAWPVGCTDPQALEPLAEPGASDAPEIFLATGRTDAWDGPVRIAYRFSGGPTAVRLTIHDVTGRLLAELVNTRLAAGSYETIWAGRSRDGAPAGSGVYFCSLEVAGQRRVERLLRVR